MFRWLYNFLGRYYSYETPVELTRIDLSAKQIVYTHLEDHNKEMMILAAQIKGTVENLLNCKDKTGCRSNPDDLPHFEFIKWATQEIDWYTKSSNATLEQLYENVGKKLELLNE